MFSYSTHMQRNANTGKRLYWTMNGLGLTPYNFLISPKLRFLPITYSIILVFWYSLQILWCFITIYNMPKLKVPLLAIIFQNFIQCLIPILVIVETLLQKSIFMREFFDYAVYTDQCFAMIGVEVDMSEMKRFVDQSFLYVTAYSIVFLITSFYTYMNLADISALAALSLSVFHFSHTIYSNYLSYYFCVLLGCFQYRFKCINDEVRAMLKTQFDGDEPVPIQVKPYGVTDVMRIKTLRCIHAVYREMVNNHNKRISIVMILQILQSIITVILSAYFLMCVLLKLIDLQDLLTYFVLLFLMNIVQCFGMVVFIAVVCCSRTSSEANYTQCLVHRLLNEIEDKEAIKQLEEFSLELVHCKVEFKSCEYFNLDYTLLTKIIGVVISHVIIFLQFGKFDFRDLIVFIRNESIPHVV